MILQRLALTVSNSHLSQEREEALRRALAEVGNDSSDDDDDDDEDDDPGAHIIFGSEPCACLMDFHIGLVWKVRVKKLQ